MLTPSRLRRGSSDCCVRIPGWASKSIERSSTRLRRSDASARRTRLALRCSSRCSSNEPVSTGCALAIVVVRPRAKPRGREADRHVLCVYSSSWCCECAPWMCTRPPLLKRRRVSATLEAQMRNNWSHACTQGKKTALFVTGESAVHSFPRCSCTGLRLQRS